MRIDSQTNATGKQHRWGIPLWLLFFLISSPAMGFGANGHRIVAKIAEHYLTPDTKASVNAVLGNELMTQAATWPDEMRSNPDPFWTNTSIYWHFINIPPGKRYEESKVNPKGNAYTALQQLITQLKNNNASLEKRRFALRFIIHIVGDLHQPLHVGHEKDRGGNTIEVKWFGETTNLHTVWDSKLIDFQQLSFSEFTHFLLQTPKEKRDAYASGDPMLWINESLQLRETVYAIGNGDFGYRYVYQHTPTIKNQLLKAGVRLATLLNQIYDPK